MKSQILTALFIIFCSTLVQAVPRFYVDYQTNTFVKDGKPFQYISGSIHSYRVPREYWSDRLNKMWAAGLNAIQLYLFWNEHEPTPGVYDFAGQNDIFEFINQAQKIGFVVIFRAGPYICGEHDYGALPWWLLSDGVDLIKPRSNEARYMKAVTRWFDLLLPKLAPYLYNNGGPIIMVQVENEYGSFPACDFEYTGQLRDLFRKHLGDETFLFTTDGNGVDYLKCGAINGTYATVDFGTGSNVSASFLAQRVFSPAGPYVNSEFYPGWLDHWGMPHQKVDTSKILITFEEMMNFKANVNFYMFHGGTNFGFSNGANQNPFVTGPTSYDYDAPLTEAGDITQKYMKLRDSISKYFSIPDVQIPANQTKKAYGKVQMSLHSNLVESIQTLSNSCIHTKKPESFEKLGQGYGFILYSTLLNGADLKNANLSVPGIRDRGYVLIGNELVGTLMRENNTFIMINLENNKENNLHIIVENMGRINFGDENSMLDTKGIISDVYLNGQILTEWTTCLTNNFIPNFQMETPGFLLDKQVKSNLSFSGPRVYIGQFKIDENYSTFLKIDKFTKGIALVGSDTITNLGRYWPSMGPQVTLYTPGVFLKANAYNYIILIEFEGAFCTSNEDCFVEFIDYPIIDSLPQYTN